VGRKQLARTLEIRLFDNGNMVYYLGMGSVVYGVDADIQGHSGSKNRYEHVRRMAEIANIFIDAGIILIITAVDLSPTDLDLFHTVLDPTRIVTIWVGPAKENSYDIHLPEHPFDEETTTRILSYLHDNGFIT
jgi:bifunctional enzyme CysN/CysC